jgi:hypothetical protein
MSGHARISTSTSTFNKSFLAKAWEARNELMDYERRGFAQFFYLTLCSHIESELALVITLRLQLINRAFRGNTPPPMKWKIDEIEHEFPLASLIQSISQITARLEAEVKSAALYKLIEHFGTVFPENINKVVGTELFGDLQSLAKLRNLSAHGRNLTMEFEVDDFSAFKGTLDGNDLKQPAERLHHAGVIMDFDIDGNNYDDFLSIFYSDEAMRYFYKAAQGVEIKLRSLGMFPPEQSWHLRHPQLPPLAP